MTFRKYLVLAGAPAFASVGDSMLARGMKEVGHISVSRLQDLILAIGDPWIVGGILFLLAFFSAYMTALSWADLTYVAPATALGNVLLALIAKFVLHEQVSMFRWIGIALIVIGVSFVASGPELTRHHGGSKGDTNQPALAGMREGQ